MSFYRVVIAVGDDPDGLGRHRVIDYPVNQHKYGMVESLPGRIDLGSGRNEVWTLAAGTVVVLTRPVIVVVVGRCSLAVVVMVMGVVV